MKLSFLVFLHSSVLWPHFMLGSVEFCLFVIAFVRSYSSSAVPFVRVKVKVIKGESKWRLYGDLFN